MYVRSVHVLLIIMFLNIVIVRNILAVKKTLLAMLIRVHAATFVREGKTKYTALGFYMPIFVKKMSNIVQMLAFDT